MWHLGELASPVTMKDWKTKPEQERETKSLAFCCVGGRVWLAWCLGLNCSTAWHSHYVVEMDHADTRSHAQAIFSTLVSKWMLWVQRRLEERSDLEIWFNFPCSIARKSSLWVALLVITSYSMQFTKGQVSQAQSNASATIPCCKSS